MDILKYKVGLPASTAGDVVSRQLTVKRSDTGGGLLLETETLETAGMELEFEAVQDSQVDLACVAVDDAGNKSEPATMSFQAVDTIAPDLSGEFSITAIGERTVPDEAPAETPPAEAAADTAADAADEGDGDDDDIHS